MDRAKVVILVVSSADANLPPEMEKLASSEEFWQRLEATPEDRLEPDQIAMLVAIGVEPPPQRSPATGG